MFVAISQNVAANCCVLGAGPHLVKFAHDHTRSTSDSARVGWFRPGQNPEQGALAGTISTYHSNAFPLAHAEGNIAK
jgi:hypothetical protein